MKHSDFHVGLEFLGSGGFQWRCTDVGTRTVVAIRLDHSAAAWYRGPPYIAQETVFDEHEMMRCHLTEEGAIRAAIAEAGTSHHPGFPHEVVTRMMTARYDTPGPRYPHGGVLRFDRRRDDGEILHPYAARQEGESWMVRVYLPFPQTWAELAEADFIELPMATAADMRARAAAAKGASEGERPGTPGIAIDKETGPHAPAYATYEGSCLCGKIRYRLTQEPGDFGYCHCVSCRKASGSSHAANAPVKREHFHLLEGETVLRKFESSPGMFRAFCSNCGSPIYAFRAQRPELLGIRLGTLDTPFSRLAKEHRYVAEKASWEKIADRLPQYPGAHG